MKKLFQEQTNLQYIFISKVMETVAGSLVDVDEKQLPKAESERLLKKVRENLYALIQKE